MADKDVEQYKLLLLKQKPQSELFSPILPSRPAAEPSTVDRASHGTALLHQLQELSSPFEQALNDQRQAGFDDAMLGHRLVFESPPDVTLALDKLSRDQAGIELLNSFHRDSVHYATVFVPDGKLVVFEKLLFAYLDPGKDGKAPANAPLLESIAAIHAASFDSLWTDTNDAIPTADETAEWEVWLPVRSRRKAVVNAFRLQAAAVGLELSVGVLEFPERTVLQARGTRQQFEQSLLTLNHIAELRRAKESADFFDALTQSEQVEWVNELLARTTFAAESMDVPHVCILDTGAKQAHPLLSPALAAADQYTNDPNWGVEDTHGHGTEMAGLALWGDLGDMLDSAEPIVIAHRLETVKLLNTNGSGGHCSEHHGILSIDAVSRPEIDSPTRLRIFSLAISAKDNRDGGRPSAWSATLDSLACDVSGEGMTPRLLVVSAGNINDPNAWEDYPESNSTDGIHDPAQAWNVLTVGAYTQKTTIEGDLTEGYQYIAPAEGLSPFSTTSASWDKHWPLKPDVVFEGGNAALDEFGASTLPSLKLLTTSHEPSRLFTTSNATSAASALASRFAAEILTAYPELWPETLRALMVHSARWTETMQQQFLPNSRKASKRAVGQLIRHCGFGVPNLERAIHCNQHSLTLVAQQNIQPFSSDARINEMHLHQLPWPADELTALGEVEVEMRVTLSYFIEPNPSARGYNSRYSYQSHGLRFDVRRASETTDEFRFRINKRARQENQQTTVSSSTDNDWVVGSTNRNHGSIHCDIWRGTAADLAERGAVAVFPTAGWWKHRKALGKATSKCRYALVISIETPSSEVDIYTSVANKIEQPVNVRVK